MYSSLIQRTQPLHRVTNALQSTESKALSRLPQLRSITRSSLCSARVNDFRHPQVPLHGRLPNSSDDEDKHAHFEAGSKKSGDTMADKNVSTYSTSYALFDTLWQLGVEHCFLNVGSDHPSIIEAIIRGKRERPDTWPRMITCPSEMTAISIADGYGRITGKPQAVIVHVDVGTQALAHGVHNASVGRAPVLVFAGLCPFTEAGELKGSRTEYMHWLQEPHDQKAIVRQYCRYVGEVKTGLNIKQNIARALQFAKSDPKGPSYLVAAREVLAQEIPDTAIHPENWTPLEPTQLPTPAARRICDALLSAKRPLLITGYSGRNQECPSQLVRLANNIPGLRVFDVGASDMCFPASHPASIGVGMSFGDYTKDADVILILDADVPWIPTRNAPPQDAKIFEIGIDPLNQQIPVSFFPAIGRWKADVLLSTLQMNDYLESKEVRSRIQQNPVYVRRQDDLARSHEERIDSIEKLGQFESFSTLGGSIVGSILRRHLPRDTVYVVEAVTQAQLIADQLQPDMPGTWINTGATGIGWSNGAALGVKLAHDKEGKSAIVVQIVGDGSYLCGSPASASWVASRYGIPVITVLLNNGGWVAPRNSTRLVYSDGLNIDATPEEMQTSFQPSPKYAEMAKAASGEKFDNGTKPALFTAQVRRADEFIEALKGAAQAVKSGRGAFVEVIYS